MRLARPAAPVTPGALGPGRSVWLYVRHRRIRGGEADRASARSARCRADSGRRRLDPSWAYRSAHLRSSRSRWRASSSLMYGCMVLTSSGDGGPGRAPWRGRHRGLAGRAEVPHSRSARAEPSASGYGFVSLSSPRPCPGPAAGRGPALLADRSRGRYDPAPPWGVTRRWACGWNLPQPAAGHDSATGPTRGTAVPPGGRLRCGARGSGRAGGRG